MGANAELVKPISTEWNTIDRGRSSSLALKINGCWLDQVTCLDVAGAGRLTRVITRKNTSENVQNIRNRYESD
jgi:hypothetical protein